MVCRPFFRPPTSSQGRVGLRGVGHVARDGGGSRAGRAGGPGPGVSLDLGLHPGAGDGNRTRMTSLEGWSSAIELHPQALPEVTRPSSADGCFGPPHRVRGYREPAPDEDRRAAALDSRPRTCAPASRLAHTLTILDEIDRFIGTAATCLPPARGLRRVVVAQAAGGQPPSGRHLAARRAADVRGRRPDPLAWCLPKPGRGAVGRSVGAATGYGAVW
jgi:hypothetical protein